MSLRSRLLIMLVVLLVLGLVGSACATFFATRADLIDLADEQLTAVGRDLTVLAEASGRAGGAVRLPSGQSADRTDDALLWLSLVRGGGSPSFFQIREPDGRVRQTVAPTGAPGLPERLTPGPATAENPDGAVLRGAETPDNGLDDWRVRTSRLPGGDVLVIGTRTAVFDGMLKQLALIQIFWTFVALALVAVMAWRAIGHLVRPLEEMALTAGAIGGGDLSRRVERAEPRTEVGRLGLALNAMLGQIESAFRQREASEQRLRRFIADASHELRTPIASVRGYAELFRRGASARPDDLAKAMHRIEAEAERMGLLVDEMLLLARLDAGRPLEREPVDLAALAGDAVADARAVEPDRPLRLDCGTEPVVVAGDAARLRQVLDNLLANVRRHTPAGTPASVRIGAADGWALVQVSDSGPGLTEEHRDRVFERFYRADESRSREQGPDRYGRDRYGGAGLGLAIVAAVAAAHEGEAEVASAPGEGTTFTVRLPRQTRSDAGSA
jgi:two-component system OmpR family sensor kinase